MNINTTGVRVLFVICITLGMVGCKSLPKIVGQTGDVGIVDSGTKTHLQTKLTMSDYLTLAETVTSKMLTSHLVQKWGESKPRLIVGILFNNTDDEGILIRDLHDRIQEVIFNSGLVRVVDKSATNFEYIIKSEITSTRQYGKDNQELVFFTLQLKMFKLDGEMVGQWSGDLALAKAKQSLF